MKYKDYIGSLPDKLYKDSVYHFDKDRLINVYQGFFEFGLKELRRDDRWSDWDVARCGFFFRMEAKNDARAIKWGSDLWIEVNDHLIKTLFEKFERRKKHLASLPEARVLTKSFPTDELYYFMFTTTTIFLYYHELGHIVQFDQSSEKQVVKERNAAAAGDKFDITSHAREYDSDEFAANFLYEQIAGNFIKRAKIKSKDVLMAIITSSIAAIFILFETLDGGFQLPIYFEEKTHPNSVIRVISITGLLLNKLNDQFHSKFRLSQSEVVKRSFEIVIPLLSSGLSFGNFHAAIRQERQSIATYSAKLRNVRDQFEWMAGVRMRKKSFNV